MSHAGFREALELKGAPKGCPTLIVDPVMESFFEQIGVFVFVCFYFWGAQLVKLLVPILTQCLMHFVVMLVTLLTEADITN